MATDDDSNDQNTNWFRRHVLEKLTDLGKGQDEILAYQQKQHEASVLHAAQDAEAFAEIRRDLDSLKLVKTLVYSFVGMVLFVVIGALIAVATGHRA